MKESSKKILSTSFAERLHFHVMLLFLIRSVITERTFLCLTPSFCVKKHLLTCADPYQKSRASELQSIFVNFYMCVYP